MKGTICFLPVRGICLTVLQEGLCTLNAVEHTTGNWFQAYKGSDHNNHESSACEYREHNPGCFWKFFGSAWNMDTRHC